MILWNNNNCKKLKKNNDFLYYCLFYNKACLNFIKIYEFYFMNLMF